MPCLNETKSEMDLIAPHQPKKKLLALVCCSARAHSAVAFSRLFCNALMLSQPVHILWSCCNNDSAAAAYNLWIAMTALHVFNSLTKD